MLKSFGGYALVVCGAIALFALPLIFLMGVLWVSLHLIPILFRIAWWMTGLTIVIALPLAILRKTRGPVATAIMYSSFFYGTTAWLLGLVLTYTHWGIFAVLCGLLTAILGVVPMGLLASAFNGWDGFVPLLSLVALTVGSSAVAALLASSAERISRREWESGSDSELLEKARAIAALEKEALEQPIELEIVEYKPKAMKS